MSDVALALRDPRMHTVGELSKGHEGITIGRVGVTVTSQPPQLATVDTIATESFGLQTNELFLLRYTNGAEWNIFTVISDESLSPFRLVRLELYGLGDVKLSGGAIGPNLCRPRRPLGLVAVYPENQGPLDIWVI